jgi:hypothetical protein
MRDRPRTRLHLIFRRGTTIGHKITRIEENIKPIGDGRQFEN